MKIFNYSLVLVFILFASLNSYSQCQSEWINTIDKDDQNAIFSRGFVMDNNENFYFTFNFYGNIKAGNLQLNGTGTPQVQEDLGIIKINMNGEPKWAVQSIRQPNASAIALTNDTRGNIYQLIHLKQKTFELGGQQLNISKDNAIVLATYDTSGNVSKLTSISEAENGNVLGAIASATTDKNNNLYILGFFSGTISLDTETITTGSVDTFNIFLAKFSPQGNLMWIKSEGKTDFIVPSGIAIDKDNNIIATAYYSGDAEFGNIPIKNKSLSGGTDGLLFKYDPNGNLLWVNSAGGLGSDYSGRVVTDAQGRIYTIGTFSTKITFGDSVLSGKSNSVYIAEYTNDGKVNKLKALAGNANIFSSTIGILTNGDFFVGGNFSKSFVIGTETIYSKASDVNNNNGFLIVFDSLGRKKNLKIIESTEFAGINPIQINEAKNIYILGAYTDNLKAGTHELSSPGLSKLFLWKTCEDYIITNLKENNNTNSILKRLEVYPNPSAGNINIEFAIIKNENVYFEVTDLAGRTMITKQKTPYLPGSYTEKLDLGSLQSGMYFVKAIANGETQTKKIIITKN